jgi:hypothetical protein
MSRSTRGRRRTSVFLGGALVALAFGVSVGLAKSGPSQVRVSMYPGFTCPVSTDKKAVGTATLTRKKGVIKVTVNLHGAVPGKYVLVIGTFDPSIPNCVLDSPGPIDRFGVDSSGDGQGSGSYTPTVAHQTYIVGVFGEDTPAAYESPNTKLGSS